MTSFTFNIYATLCRMYIQIKEKSYFDSQSGFIIDRK